MRWETLITEQQQRVMTITLNRPSSHNALSTPCLQELQLALEAAEQDHDIGAVVITGNLRCFAAGADLKEMSQQDLVTLWQDRRPQVWQSIDAFSKPLIAAVNGYALGAGCELALLCDVIIAGDNAQFGLPEITLGIMPGAGGTQRLIRTIGKSLAHQMVLSGEAIDANTALRAGLVSTVTLPALTVESAQKLAQRMASRAPLALRAAKSALKQAQELSLSQGLQAERQQFVTLAGTQDRQEGIQAFLDKRTPTFSGR